MAASPPAVPAAFDPQQRKAFLLAVSTGDVSALRRVLSMNSDLARSVFVKKTSTGELKLSQDPLEHLPSGLLLSIQMGHDAIFEELLDCNFAMLSTSPRTAHLLMELVASFGHLKMAKKLRSFLPLHNPSDRLFTPLMRAAREGHPKMVRFLLSLPALYTRQFSRDDALRSALTHAAFAGAVQCMSLLLPHSPTANAEPEENRNDLRTRQQQQLDAAQSLVAFCEKAPLGVPNEPLVLDLLAKSCVSGGVLRALMKSVEHGHLDRVKQLFSFVAVDAKPTLGPSPLTLAADQGHLDIVQFLLNHVNVNQMDNRGRTALMRACLSNRPQCVELLAPLSDVSIMDAACDDAMGLASLDGHWQCAEIVARHLDDASAVEKLQRYPTQLPQLRARLERKALVQSLEPDTLLDRDTLDRHQRPRRL